MDPGEFGEDIDTGGDANHDGSDCECSEEDDIVEHTIVYMEDNDTVDDLDVTYTGIITGCLIYGGQISRRKIRHNKTSVAAPDDIETDYEDPLQCQTCKKRFTHPFNFTSHVCKGLNGKRDLLHYALKYAHQQLDQPQFSIMQIKSEKMDDIYFLYSKMQIV